MRFPWTGGLAREEKASFWLRRRISAALLLVSSVPFLLLGTGAWFVFRSLAIEQSLARQRTIVRAHAAAIDLYLSEKLHALELIARNNSKEALSNPETLQAVFGSLSAVYQDAFVDLGVIDDGGNHLAYVGPYDLMNRTYREAEWFQTVLTEGSIVSDVFLGHRQLPHSVVAVRQSSPAGWWILRATLDNRRLYSLVGDLAVGEAGDVFLVNREGILQTPSRTGEVLGPSRIADLGVHPDVRDRRVEVDGQTVRQVTTGLNRDRWLLVVQQSEEEILAPVHRAVVEGGMMAALAVVLVFVATVLITSRLIHRVEEADAERDRMYGDLIRSAKLASLGEMATGLAHEINNPLAIISAEQTNLEDELLESSLEESVLAGLKESIDRSKRQVRRCGEITAKMLQFGRDTGTTLEATELEPVLREIGALLERRARANNVVFRMEVEPELPLAMIDANELEQVLVNLVNNAMDALGREGSVRVSVRQVDGRLLLTVEDDGKGIAPEDLDRIFQPFFTTKPIGKGTGLGLAVVYGIIRGWGGTIHVDSTPGAGTRVAIHLPLADRAHLGKS